MSETQRQLLADILDAKEGESLASSSAALAEQREEEHDGITLSFEEQINAFVDGDIPPEETAAAKDRPCIECEDQASEVYCTSCKDNFCTMCFLSVHRKGSRKRHRLLRWPYTMQSIKAVKTTSPVDAVEAPADAPGASETPDESEKNTSDVPVQYADGYSGNAAWYLERAKYIPLRLSLKERKLLRLLEAALNVSEYTDKVDVYTTRTPRNDRIVKQLRDICAILSGLVLAADFPAGQELLKDRDFSGYAEWFQDVFEVGRRYKIMSPEKLRSSYGKLVYLLQDSQIETVRDMLDFDCARPLQTVYTLLEKKECLDLLADPLMPAATMEIMSAGRSRHAIQQDIRKKEHAIDRLAATYCSSELSEDKIKTILYSIGDQHAFLRGSRDIVDRTIAYLEKYFPEKNPPPHLNLSIQFGEGGARLSHDHQRQYLYCKQTLYLWRELLHDFFKLWNMAEADLLDPENPYRLRDTGQGLNRLQGCPRVSREVHAILSRVMQRLGRWVGSSVIHLGDANVPNALMFIDKYTQVTRILGPIVTCLDQIDRVAKENAQVRQYLDNSFTDAADGVEGAKVLILRDFFRHAFDGRGADNAFSAGSCIDGRLTSAWHWTSEIEKKSYFPVFLLTGYAFA